MEQLLVHLFGDYIAQNDYLALNKSKNSWICLIHVLIYTACFLILTLSWKALFVIGITHFILDRWHFIIRRLIWFKNHLGPGLKYVPYTKCQGTGYYDNLLNEITDKFFTAEEINGYTPRLNYITLWLYIITDNFFHLTINFFALKYL